MCYPCSVMTSLESTVPIPLLYMPDTGAIGHATEEDELKLDAEAEALLEELAASQAEVQRMLKLQKEQAVELGGLKAQLAAEVTVANQSWTV